mgnify:FL=1
MKNSKTIIFGALKVNALRFEITSDDTVIACDKGILNCEKLGVSPDKIIGDFDSLGFVPDGENVTKLPVKKDETDVGFAIKTAFLSGSREIYVYGACGGKLDHSIANISLCAAYVKKGARVVFFGEDTDFTCISPEIPLEFSEAQIGGRLSVFALSECFGVNIINAEYPLENACLNPLFPLGVSNAFIKGEKTRISLNSGLALAVWDNKSSSVI